MSWRTIFAFGHDAAAVVLAWYISYWLRFNLDIPAEFLAQAHAGAMLVAVAYTLVFLRSGLYRGLWRYASVLDLRRILVAVAAGALIVATIIHLSGVTGVPRSVLLLQPLLLVVIMGGSRFAYRAWKDGHLMPALSSDAESVLVLGGGDAASALLRELRTSGKWRAVGLLDDDRFKHGRQIQGVTVLGPIADVAQYARKTGTTHVVIAMPSVSAKVRRRAAELAVQAGLGVMTVPAVADLLSGRVSISNIRKVELEDLLGREQVQIDDIGLHRLLTDKVVLVTGAGGSIGAELCRQIARFSPKLLVFYELSEFALYRMEQEFAGSAAACVVGDVKDGARLDAVFRQYRPDVVFHAAAYKHVPIMENDNAWEAVRNNVLGTYRVAQAAMAHGATEFVFISTDKAVNPTNVMGASKRLAELVCQAVQRQGETTKFVTVRFGNVLGSSGSVIPKFREQIARGGPVTVTHPDIIRYFMLIPEAAQLVLQAGLMGKGGEIFVLDMGEPVKIADLARDLIRLSGFGDDDIRIEFTGLRPGEKLYEELLADNESTLPTPHPKLRIAKATEAPGAAWCDDLLAWLAEPVREEAEVKADLGRRVPEYRPAEH
jgi:FlaA1/EpsC-like NDP-sugar epimerase